MVRRSPTLSLLEVWRWFARASAVSDTPVRREMLISVSPDFTMWTLPPAADDEAREAVCVPLVTCRGMTRRWPGLICPASRIPFVCRIADAGTPCLRAMLSTVSP
jgi:hypothetical protein